MLFGREKPHGKTVLILDIENGSVGAALARLGAQGDLTLLGEYRRYIPLHTSRSAEALAHDTEVLAREAIEKMSELAARLRNTEADPSLGVVSNVSAFMSPPWGKPNLTSGRPDFAPHIQDMLRREISPFVEAPVSFYTSAGAATQGLRAASPYEDKYLLCIVTHEMTELVLMYNGGVVGHATIPHGMNLPLRTLKTHGGFSDTEARSLLHLGHDGQTSHHASAALDSATAHYAQEFKGAARELLDSYAPQQVWVVSPAGEYFAHTLSHESLTDIFPQGGVVRALRPHHLHKHMPSTSQDLLLILEALYLRYTQ